MEQRTGRAGLFFGHDAFFAEFVAFSWSPIVTASDASASGYAVCVGHWNQQKVAQHGRILERSRFKRNPGASARDSFFQANDFVKGADGLWHPCTELDHPGVRSVWSQVIVFPEVELRLLQKRSWRVVIIQAWRFEDDIVLREARALLRGLPVMVRAEHVRNARVLCLTEKHVLCACI